MPRPAHLKGGSRKGKPNKASAELKDMIRAALDGVGGVDYLKKKAETHPGPFLTLVGKTLPLQVEGGMTINLTITKDMAGVG